MDLVIVPKSDLQDLLDKSFRSALISFLEASQPEKPTAPKEWITNGEAQTLLGLSKTTLQRYRADGILPYSKLGGNIYYRVSDIVDILEGGLRIQTGMAR